MINHTDFIRSLGNGALFVVVVLALLPVQSVVGGALLKCTGKNGATIYTNKQGNYSGCRVISSYKDVAQPKPKAKPAEIKLPETIAIGTAATSADKPLPPIPATPAKAEEPLAPLAPRNSPVQRGAVYKYVRGGITHYTNVKPRNGGYRVLFTYITTCRACEVHSPIDWDSTRLNTTAYVAEIAAAGALFGVDQALLRALIHAESAFDANALSNKGAQGLMQLMPGTAGDYGVGDAFDPRENIMAGTQHLAMLLNKYHGDERLAAAAYNAGAGAVAKYGGVPPYAETQVYVDRVAILRKRYLAGQ